MKKFKNTLQGGFFQKWFPTSRSQRVFTRPNFSDNFFLVRINFKGNYYVKLKPISIFWRTFFLVRFILKGISNIKFKAVSNFVVLFQRDFFLFRTNLPNRGAIYFPSGSSNSPTPASARSARVVRVDGWVDERVIILVLQSTSY